MRPALLSSLVLILAACDDSGLHALDAPAGGQRAAGDPTVTIDRSAPTREDAEELGLVATVDADTEPDSDADTEADTDLDTSQHAPVDTDGDGLWDAFEVQQGLNPNLPDTDGDGIHDLWDLLGSEFTLHNNDDDGFAWFDPSQATYHFLQSNLDIYNIQQLFGIHHRATVPAHVVVFGTDTWGPLKIDCYPNPGNSPYCATPVGPPPYGLHSSVSAFASLNTCLLYTSPSPRD